MTTTPTEVPKLDMRETVAKVLTLKCRQAVSAGDLLAIADSTVESERLAGFIRDELVFTMTSRILAGSEEDTTEPRVVLRMKTLDDPITWRDRLRLLAFALAPRGRRARMLEQVVTRRTIYRTCPHLPVPRGCQETAHFKWIDGASWHR